MNIEPAHKVLELAIFTRALDELVGDKVFNTRVQYKWTQDCWNLYLEPCLLSCEYFDDMVQQAALQTYILHPY